MDPNAHCAFPSTDLCEGKLHVVNKRIGWFLHPTWLCYGLEKQALIWGQ